MFFSQPLFAQFRISKINQKKTRAIIEKVDLGIDTPKVGDTLRVTNEFAEVCNLKVYSVNGGGIVIDLSTCAFGSRLIVGTELSLANSKAVTQVVPASELDRSRQENSLKPYVQNFSISYEGASIDGITEDITGFSLAGTLDLNQKLFLSAGFGSFKVSSVDVDVSTLGFGIQSDLGVSSKLLIGVNWAESTIKSSSTTVKDDNTGAQVALLHRLSQETQVSGRVGISSGNTTFGFSLFRLISPRVSIGIGASSSDDSSSYYVGFQLIK